MDMRVAIEYPQDFALTGWKKGIFEVRVVKMFQHGYVDIVGLKELRTEVAIDDANEEEVLAADLRQLHCIDFSKLPKSVIAELPKRIGEYLGVQIHRTRRLNVAALVTSPPVLTVVIMAAMALASWAVAVSMPSPKRVHFEPPLAQVAPTALPVAEALQLVTNEGAAEASAVLRATLTTVDPNKALRMLARVPTERGKRYNVEVTVRADGNTE